jgi:hypothetical protein
MTHKAILVGWDMIVVFSSGGLTIVTIDAAAIDAIMIKRGSRKDCGVMAHATILIII